MEINNYVKTPAPFLKAQDVKDNPTATFIPLSEGEMVKSEKFGNDRLHLVGEFNKEAKTFDLSKTNAFTVAQKIGFETKKWIGHKIHLETYKTKTSDGKMTDAINVKNVE